MILNLSQNEKCSVTGGLLSAEDKEEVKGICQKECGSNTNSNQPEDMSSVELGWRATQIGMVVAYLGYYTYKAITYAVKAKLKID